MTGFTPKQWGYAVGTTPVPASPVRKGRFHLVRGTSHTTVQAVVADPRGGAHNEAAWREFALSGRAGDIPQPREPESPAGQPPPMPELPPGQVFPAISRVLIGPQQAADHLGITRETFRMRRRRYPIRGEFKSRVRGQDVTCWTPETLDQWDIEILASR
jgi:hypothetical protein